MSSHFEVLSEEVTFNNKICSNHLDKRFQLNLLSFEQIAISKFQTYNQQQLHPICTIIQNIPIRPIDNKGWQLRRLSTPEVFVAEATAGLVLVVAVRNILTVSLA